MNPAVTDRIIALHNSGLSYSKISEQLNVPVNTIKSIFYNVKQQEKPKGKTCPNCGKAILNARANRIYCCNKCRYSYHNQHPHFRSKFSAVTECPVCRKSFRYHLSQHRKYCSRECSLIARFGEIAS